MNKAKQVWNFVTRHLVWIVLTLAGLYLIGTSKQFLLLIASIVTIGGLTIFLASVALWAYTKINFQEADSDIEQASKIVATALVFVGVAIVVAGCVFGMYYIYFAQ